MCISSLLSLVFWWFLKVPFTTKILLKLVYKKTHLLNCISSLENNAAFIVVHSFSLGKIKKTNEALPWTVGMWSCNLKCFTHNPVSFRLSFIFISFASCKRGLSCTSTHALAWDLTCLCGSLCFIDKMPFFVPLDAFSVCPQLLFCMFVCLPATTSVFCVFWCFCFVFPTLSLYSVQTTLFCFVCSFPMLAR